MYIKENYHIYRFKQLKELIEKEKSTKDNDNQNSMFDIALIHEYTPIKNVTANRDINTPHNTPRISASTRNDRRNNSTTHVRIHKIQLKKTSSKLLEC
jgi:hypothetical protein